MVRVKWFILILMLVRNDVAWTLGVNANLPDDIAVRWVHHVDEEFHARFSATWHVDIATLSIIAIYVLQF